MHIISKYKDYYDGVAGSVGIDKTCRYMREPRYVSYDFKDISHINGWQARYHLPTFKSDDAGRWYKHPKGKADYYNYFIIGFCGKLYIGYYFKWKGTKEYYSNPEGTDDVELITYDPKKIIDLTFNFKKNDSDTKKAIAEFKSTWDAIHKTDAIEIFREFKAPVFVNDPNCQLNKEIAYTTEQANEWHPTQVNPTLKTYQFAKIFEPYMAFQELSMFIGSVLVNPENNMVEVADEYRMASRGLDKTSFRQDTPGRKKENRRINKERKRNVAK